MLLVSLDRVDRSLPKEAAARIRSAGASLLGMVTNAVKEETASNSAYGYGYGKYGYGGYKGYGYGYGSYDPRSAYAYYQPESQDAATRASTQRNQVRERFRLAKQKLMRWIDS
jgi:hypothetical protein